MSISVFSWLTWPYAMFNGADDISGIIVNDNRISEMNVNFMSGFDIKETD